MTDSHGCIPDLQMGEYKLWFSGAIATNIYWVVSDPDTGLSALCGLSYFKIHHHFSVEELIVIPIVRMDKLRYKEANWLAQVSSAV